VRQAEETRDFPRRADPAPSTTLDIMEPLEITADWSFWNRRLPPAVLHDVALPRALDPRTAISV
jgi:hypothetical protein